MKVAIAILAISISSPALSQEDCKDAGDESHPDTVYETCIGAMKYKADDIELNNSYKALITFIRSSGQDESAKQAFRKTVIESQRAWLKYRISHCRSYGLSLFVTPSSRTGIFEYNCLSELTNARTKELNSLREEADGVW